MLNDNLNIKTRHILAQVTYMHEPPKRAYSPRFSAATSVYPSLAVQPIDVLAVLLGAGSGAGADGAAAS